MLCLLTTIVFGQFHVSTNSRIDFTWNEENKDWEFESEDEELLTFLNLIKNSLWLNIPLHQQPLDI